MPTRDSVYVDVIAETKKAVAGMAKFAAGVGAAVLILRKLKSSVDEMVQLYGQQEMAERKLATAIRITGHEGEISTEAMIDYAKQLQNITVYGDEATLSAMAMVQQLSDLNEKGLKQITPLIQDFASAMDLDLEMAASLVGKTLGSTTNALTRYGVVVDMSGTKTEKLASLTEALEGKFGGMSEELAGTTLGRMQQMQNAMGDFKETVGGFIAIPMVPMIQRMTRFINTVNEGITRTIELGRLQKKVFDEMELGEQVRLRELELKQANEMLKGLEETGRASSQLGWQAPKEALPQARKDVENLTLELAGLKYKLQILNDTPLPNVISDLSGPGGAGDAAEDVNSLAMGFGLLGKILRESEIAAGIKEITESWSIFDTFMGLETGKNLPEIMPKKHMAGGWEITETKEAFAGAKPYIDEAALAIAGAGEEMANLNAWGVLFGQTLGSIAGGAEDMGAILKRALSAGISLLATALAVTNPLAGAGLAAAGAFVGSFQGGGEVPRTGLALVHQGEHITPAGGGQSITVINHVHGSVLTERQLASIAVGSVSRAMRPY